MIWNIIIYGCGWAGLAMLAAAFCGGNSIYDRQDQHSLLGLRQPVHLGILLLVAAIAVFLARPADAQVQMIPGQAITMCNTIGSTTGGGVVCAHDVVEQRIELNYMNPSWHITFWGDGSAASMLQRLCLNPSIHTVTETVFEPELVRVRTIPCTTGKSDVWVVYEVSES